MKTQFKIHETIDPKSIILELPDGQHLHISAKKHKDGLVLKMHNQNTDYDVLDLYKKSHGNSIEIMVGARVDVDL